MGKEYNGGVPLIVSLAVLAGGAVIATALWNRAMLARAPRVVPRVDLARYAGRWYEIARLPNHFQSADCVAITANYTLRDDGSIIVLNQCRRRRNGHVEIVRGTARIADPATPAKLKVSFGWPIVGNYWILDLGEEYEYAVVGEPTRRYLWILARVPRMEDALWQAILPRLRAQGYDTDRLIRQHGSRRVK
jgi:apolipoprotein D and lipocalin family protein